MSVKKARLYINTLGLHEIDCYVICTTQTSNFEAMNPTKFDTRQPCLSSSIFHRISQALLFIDLNCAGMWQHYT